MQIDFALFRAVFKTIYYSTFIFQIVKSFEHFILPPRPGFVVQRCALTSSSAAIRSSSISVVCPLAIVRHLSLGPLLQFRTSFPSGQLYLSIRFLFEVLISLCPGSSCQWNAVCGLASSVYRSNSFGARPISELHQGQN